MKKLVSLLLLVLMMAMPLLASAEKVNINVFTNLPDRTTGQGLVEQMLFDAYMAQNPDVTITYEALEDESYKTKFKAYAAGTQMPDLVSVWGQPAFIDEVIEAGLLAELDPADYADEGFLEGSMSGFSAGGKLYGLPRNTDMMVFYYNKKIFEDNGWNVPGTLDELFALGDAIKAAGLIPVSMDGGDKWPLSIYYTDLCVKLGGAGLNGKLIHSIASHDWSDPMYLQAAKLLQESAGRLFQIGFETTDYGTAMNYFINGQAAMYYMGSWEMSMAAREGVPAEVRENIGAFTMPVIEGGAGSATDISAWNGGGYSVTANAAAREEAVKLLNFMFEADHWNKETWENNVCMSAQDFSVYMTGEETPVQIELVGLLTGSSSISGTTMNDLGTSEYKTKVETLSQELAIGSITPEGFIEALTNLN